MFYVIKFEKKYRSWIWQNGRHGSTTDESRRLVQLHSERGSVVRIVQFLSLPKFLLVDSISHYRFDLVFSNEPDFYGTFFPRRRW